MMALTMKTPGLLVASLALALPARAQHVSDPHASAVEVATRQAALRAPADPLLGAAAGRESASPGKVLSEADRLECLFFGGFDPHFEGEEPPGL
jgi:hypothetical protein